MARRRPVDPEPSYNDRRAVDLMHTAMRQIRAPGRVGDRKVFIAPLWDKMRELDDPDGPTAGATLEDFKGWLLRSFQLVGDDGQPMFRMARADLVSAMDPDLVAASEIRLDRNVTYHFVIDPAVDRPSGYVPNPPWATEAVADAWETMSDKVPVPWLPKLRDIRADGAYTVLASIREYGCGVYGCVYPTSDPLIVMKLTTDSTEAEFAARYANELVRPICVRYYTVIRLAAQRDGRTIYLLWRESADHVGKIGTIVGMQALEEISRQHAAAQVAYKVLRKAPGTDRVTAAIDKWLEMCRLMVLPEVRDLGQGMLEIWERQHILFGDVHAGNVGLVARDDGGHWVITDPGNIAVVTP